MATGPHVTVIIPTNRSSPYLPTTIASIERQTWTDWDLVIVDDGSPDAAALDLFAAGRGNRQVLHCPARGVSAARNAGIAAARGEYLAFIDDDDVWHPDFLALHIAELESHSSAIACYSSGWLMDAEGAQTSTSWPPTGASRDALLRGQMDLPFLQSLVVSRVASITAGCFNSAFICSEDMEFIFRLLRLGDLASIPEKLVGYRRYDSSVMSGLSFSTRQESARRAITLQIWEAQSRKDWETLEMLRENLRRFERKSASATVGNAVESARRRSPLQAVTTLSKGMLRSPGAMMSAVMSRVSKKFSS